MEVLNNVLSAMKLAGGVFLEAEFSAPWCVTSKIGPQECARYFPEPEHVIGYHYVRSGKLLCSVGAEPPIEISEGQIFMTPRNESHRLGSCLDIEPTDSASIVSGGDQGGLWQIRWGGGGEVTRLYCGFLGTLTPINALLMNLPSILVIDASQGTTGEWLASSIRYASISGGGVAPEVVGKLAELLFVEAVKQHLASLPEGEDGWFSGLRDSHVSNALALMHGDCAKDWTIECLAREVGLSRSALADRFTRLMGDPPMRYLAKHRMQVAAQMLREGQDHAGTIAYAVGFGSEASFSRAFKKEFGVAPGTWRRQRRAFA